MEDKCFIDNGYIEALLDNAKNTDDKQIETILSKAEKLEGLSHEDVAALLVTEKKEHWDRIFEVAGRIKLEIYGERVVFFAPLYVSDYCVNKCAYCGFNHGNEFPRRRLTMDEIRAEVRILENMGHKRLALEAGEDSVNCPIEYILECIKTIYDMKSENGEIRRVNVNIAATTEQNYAKLKDVGIGTYILFQETYSREVYERMHIAGPKADYLYHLTAFDRAMRAGIDDVGGGVLFGLNDHRYEVLGLMLHNEHLEKEFGVGFHTISMPRICDADGVDRVNYKYAVDDDTFLRITAIIRLAVPFTGMIISTRESAEMRKKLIGMGVSQISGGSTVEVGGYTLREKKGAQFTVADNRPARDVIYWVMEEGLIPSFCTACYRSGRTGDRFMRLAKTGNIKNVCMPNAIMTLKEYALDYADAEFREKADNLITEKLKDIEDGKTKDLLIKNLERLENGERDLFI